MEEQSSEGGRLSDFYASTAFEGEGNVELGSARMQTSPFHSAVPNGVEGPPPDSTSSTSYASRRVSVYQPGPHEHHDERNSILAPAILAPVKKLLGAVASTSAAITGVEPAAKPEDETKDPPDNVSVELWNKLKHRAEHHSGTRKQDQVLKDILDFANVFQPPQGFSDVKLWGIIVKGVLENMSPGERENHKAMCKNIHERFLDAEKSNAKTKIWESRVLNFFLDWTSNDFNIDAAVNAFALVNALILTIPFGIVTSLDHEWLSSVKKLTEPCPGMYTHIWQQFILRLSGSVYCSMLGLILSALYYIFSPADKTQLTDNGCARQRLLILSAFACTVGSIVFCNCSWASLLYLFMRDYNAPEDAYKISGDFNATVTAQRRLWIDEAPLNCKSIGNQPSYLDNTITSGGLLIGFFFILGLAFMW